MLAVTLVLSQVCAAAPFTISNTLGDHAVLQNPIIIWGTGVPGETISTTVAQDQWHQKEEYTCIVGADGVWRQPLETLGVVTAHNTPGPEPYTIAATSSTRTTITLSDILVGKVLLCSGQSNIDLVSVSKAFNGTNETAACGANTNLRTARTTRIDSWTDPLVDLPALQQSWSAPTPTNCADFSATCYFAARDLYNSLGSSTSYKTPVGIVMSAAGGTAVRNWVPERGLAACSQPWSGMQPYGAGPYSHSGLYNAMIHAFGTGPTTFSAVVWDQAESDSYPQTMPGYYSCQTLSHVNSWRQRFKAPLLPWIFVHLQPYGGAENNASPIERTCGDLVGNPLAELRHEQLSALQLANTAYASAMDLGDPDSPYGNVHFQNKQEVAKRIVAAALVVAFPTGQTTAASDAAARDRQERRRSNSSSPLNSRPSPPPPPPPQITVQRPYYYPPQQFLGQVPAKNGTGCSMTVTFDSMNNLNNKKLMMGATPNPTPRPTNGSSSAVCPVGVNRGGTIAAVNCSGFELLCASSDAARKVNPYQWLPATPTLSADGTTLTLTAPSGTSTSLLARGSRYAWNDWPLATLFQQGVPGNPNAKGLPILPWNQALTCTGGLPGAIC